MYEKPAKAAVLAQRLVNFAAPVLALVLFFVNRVSGPVYITLFILWIAYTVFRMLKTLANLLQNPGSLQEHFTAMLARWETEMNGKKMALAVFTFITVVSCLFKLAVPFILVLAAQG